MKLRMTLAFLIGGWCAATVFMWFVAMKNFQIVDAILAAPPDAFSNLTAPLEAGDLREAMRYQASEVNRLFFAGWGWVQIPVAFAVAALAWKSVRRTGFRLACIATLVITLFLGLHVVPWTVRLGRTIDFATEEQFIDQRAAFWRLHHMYTGLDMLKFLTLLGAFVVLVKNDRKE